jgi:hypothetical protein
LLYMGTAGRGVETSSAVADVRAARSQKEA